MAKSDMQFKVNIDSQALNFFKHHAPEKLRDARKAGVEIAGKIWADASKDITTEEDHIDTSLYVNSIGYATGSPADPIYNLEESNDKTKLQTGADVSYAEVLEKRYAIMARGLDRATPRIRANVWRQVRKALDL